MEEKRPWESESNSAEVEVEPPRKKQLRKRTCLVCDVEKGINQFPSPKKVSSHEHDQNVCRHCYLGHLKIEISSKNWDDVACPECPIALTYKEVKDMTTTENFAKYEQACIRATLAADPDFRHCLSTACESGQLHPGGADEPIFRCQECGHKHCVVCEANWHEDQTCEEFEAAREVERQRNAENEQSQKEVDKISKPCPECRVPIQKNQGCDHMTCSRCRHEFCWVCSAQYNHIRREGNHRHEKTCTHYRGLPSAVPRRRSAVARRTAQQARPRPRPRPTPTELARENSGQGEALQQAQETTLASGPMPGALHLDTSTQ
ncbi:hypothetical protein E4T48_02122 [Aureobasidium sp. EXF-10727]|nr:hypothetical protein E4T48_02122 [Aureobasidium sp. EXF-10727]